MPLLLTDFPPYSRPKPKLSQEPGAAPCERERIPQGEAAAARLRELEAALVTMLTLLWQRPDAPQPLGAINRQAWWWPPVNELGWTRAQFSEALWTLRGGGFVGWGDGCPEGLTRRGIREAILLKREGVSAWAPPTETEAMLNDPIEAIELYVDMGRRVGQVAVRPGTVQVTGLTA